MAIAGFGEIAEQLRRSTVLIHSGGRGSGSGVIWSSDGLIVTNAHVVRGSNVRVQLWDGREFEGAVASRDPRRDLAALRISADSLPAASPADSSQLRPGELAIAIGNPMGFVGALTTGVIHAIDPLRALGSQTWVQASVRLAPGNSAAGHWLTRVATLLGLTQWLLAASRSPFRATQFAILLRADRAAPGLALPFIPCACLVPLAARSDWSCWKSSRIVQPRKPRLWLETFCWERKNEDFNRWKTLRRRSMVKTRACCVSNFFVAITRESVA